MNQEKYRGILERLLNHLMDNINECEPEFKADYIGTILEVTDRINALGRKLNA